VYRLKEIGGGPCPKIVKIVENFNWKERKKRKLKGRLTTAIGKQRQEKKRPHGRRPGSLRNTGTNKR